MKREKRERKERSGERSYHKAERERERESGLFVFLWDFITGKNERGFLRNMAKILNATRLHGNSLVSALRALSPALWLLCRGSAWCVVAVRGGCGAVCNIAFAQPPSLFFSIKERNCVGRRSLTTGKHPIQKKHRLCRHASSPSRTVARSLTRWRLTPWARPSSWPGRSWQW